MLAIGSPRVFHTAPPQPASKARITWSPQFAGGPEASQKGFGQRMPPAKFVVKSAIYASHTVPRHFTCGGVGRADGDKTSGFASGGGTARAPGVKGAIR